MTHGLSIETLLDKVEPEYRTQLIALLGTRNGSLPDNFGEIFRKAFDDGITAGEDRAIMKWARRNFGYDGVAEMCSVKPWNPRKWMSRGSIPDKERQHILSLMPAEEKVFFSHQARWAYGFAQCVQLVQDILLEHEHTAHELSPHLCFAFLLALEAGPSTFLVHDRNVVAEDVLQSASLALITTQDIFRGTSDPAPRTAQSLMCFAAYWWQQILLSVHFYNTFCNGPDHE